MSVGRLEPERCKDCGLLLAPWLRLYCTKCVQQHLIGEAGERRLERNVRPAGRRG